MENPFLFFDDIICINLKSRDDRYKYMLKIFEEFDIPGRILRFDKSSKGGIYGCFESHIKVIEESYINGLSNVLIFEDDIKPTSSFSKQHIKNAIAFMKTNTWDLFYFGFFVINLHADFIYFADAVKNNTNIIKYKGLGTHAYCINRNGMKHILSTYNEYIGKEHIDVYLSRRSSLITYSYIPILFDQKFCFTSDIPAKNTIEYSLRNIQCEIEKKEVNYRVSLFTFYLIQYYRYILCVLMIVTIILIYIYNHKAFFFNY